MVFHIELSPQVLCYQAFNVFYGQVRFTSFPPQYFRLKNGQKSDMESKIPICVRERVVSIRDALQRLAVVQ